MDDVAVGRGFRALRKRKGWSQRQLAARALVPQSTISLIEAGRFERVRLATVRRVGRALTIVIELGPRWPIANVANLLDADHARLVESVVRELRRRGWEVVTEYTFNDFGDRGSVDVLAWHPVHRALLIVEVKTRIVDVQDLHASFDRKTRVVPRLIGRERGWRPTVVGRLLVAAATTANRDAVARHEATFQAAFPGESIAAKRWVRDPVGPLSAIWFLRNIRPTDRVDRRQSVPNTSTHG
jgi:transcriptional regulator with XRE-family HTH domain